MKTLALLILILATTKAVARASISQTSKAYDSLAYTLVPTIIFLLMYMEVI